MKYLLLSLLLLAPGALLADDTFRVEARVVELAADSPAPTEFPAAGSLPRPSDLIVKAGQEGRVVLGNLFKLRDATSGATTDIPLGITISVTPVLKDAQLTYRAQVTHSVPIFSTRATVAISAAEVATRTYYQSGPCEAGEPFWFNYKHPDNGKTMFIALRLSKEAA